MKDWRDSVIEFLRKYEDEYFTIDWLSNHFNTTIDVMNDLIEQFEELGMVTHIKLYINSERLYLYKFI